MGQAQPKAAIEKQAAQTATRLTLRDYVTGAAVKQRLADVASKYLQPDEIVRCVLLAASRNPKIADCTQDSILRCMMEAAVIGVRPGGIMGRGYLIPRWNSKIRAFECNFDPGYRGLSDIARRSKVVSRIEARVVHQLDTFRVIEGTAPSLVHEPYGGDEDPGAVRASYAVAFFADNTTQHEVVWRRDLDKMEAVSTSKDDKGNSIGPWLDWYDEQARKSAVRRLCKHLPCDEELEYALEVATRAELPSGEAVPQMPEVTDAEPPRAKKLADKIRANTTGFGPEREPEPAARKSSPPPARADVGETDGEPPDDYPSGDADRGP
jgi:recombination protein RecT